MKSTVLWALVILNAVLAASFLSRIMNENAAMAQVRPQPQQQQQQQQLRRPGDYVMIPGEVTGGPSGLVYMLDTTNGILGAITYDDTRREIGVMPTMDLARIFELGAQPAVPPQPRR
jgi:hypothetical protein